MPSKFAICRFRRKLVGFADAVADVLTATVNQLRDTLPGFGETVAVDATDVKAWANGFHQDTDPDAATGAKKKGVQSHYYWYGYKVHLAVDADAELPIWFTLTPANAYDGSQLAPVLSDARERFDWFSPSYVTADKGYDAKASFRFIGEDLGATPVIDVQRTHKPKEDAKPMRLCEAQPVTDLLGEVRFECHRRPFDRECPVFTSCRWYPRKRRVAPVERQHYTEAYTSLAYGSAEWKGIYNKRVSVERVFSRLKSYRKLNAIRTRRMPKVWLHVALSLVAMNSAAIVGGGSRRCVA